MEKSCPSVCPSFFFFFSGEWGCMATVRSAMCVLSGAGALGARPHLNKCFMERKRRCFRMDEVSGQLQLVSTAEKLCWGSSVYACAKCVCLCLYLCAYMCVCVRMCVCVCVRVLVSCLFLWCSHRGASRNIISPLWQHFPRHHCTTQHLCLFALGLPAPAVIRKDRKTGLWSPMQTLGPMLS